MAKPLGRKHLAMALSRVPPHPAPRADLEQVQTPGEIAADLLLAAAEHGDIEGRTVVDMGCGTGVLGIGAALLGATRVVGIDVDAASLVVARGAADAAGVADRSAFHEADVSTLTPDQVRGWAGGAVDTVVMNPPFGADRSSRSRGGDRVFLGLALGTAGTVLSLHLAETERFLTAFARDAGFAVATLGTVDFPLVARFAHHRSERRLVRVGIYHFARVSAPA